jgi:hypothetical protein
MDNFLFKAFFFNNFMFRNWKKILFLFAQMHLKTLKALCIEIMLEKMWRHFCVVQLMGQWSDINSWM